MVSAEQRPVRVLEVLRLQRRLTTGQVAARVGCARCTLTRWNAAAPA
jgi:transcriptional regulator with XRE-family HTH domain